MSSAMCLRMVTFLTVFVALAFPQNSQNPQPEPDRQWEQFFRTVHRLQMEADQQLAANQPEVWRHYLRNEIGISAFDEQKLNIIAAEFIQKCASLDSQEHALVAAFHKQYPPGALAEPFPQPSTQLQVISKQRRQIAMQELEQLRERLPDLSYERVNTWVTKKEKRQ